MSKSSQLPAGIDIALDSPNVTPVHLFISILKISHLLQKHLYWPSPSVHAVNSRGHFRVASVSCVSKPGSLCENEFNLHENV